MKNMNNRTKIILAIAAALIVIAVGVGIALNQDLIGELSGTAFTLNVEPDSLTLYVGEFGNFSTGTILNNCSWTISNPGVAELKVPSDNHVTVFAKSSGTAIVTETCGRLGRYQGSATLRVVDDALRPTNP